MGNSTKKIKREPLYDVIKGLGIICIVLGHCTNNVSVCNFVYSFHLALFVFVSGMQINSGKYAMQPWSLITNRMRRMWPGYFGYFTVFTLAHDLLVRFKLHPWQAYYEKSELAVRIFNNFIFRGSEAFAGAMWFVPMLLAAVALFAIIVYVSYTYCGKFKIVVAGIFSCLAGWLGIVLNTNGVSLALHAHTSFLLLPVMYIGYILTCMNIDKQKFFRTVAALPCILVIWLMVIKPGTRIDLAAELIGSPYRFYLITFAGIYLICVIAKWLCKYEITRRIFSHIGKYSFDIMALHFFLFKVTDRIWEILWPNPDLAVTTFPCTDRSRWPVYLLMSVVFAPLIRMAFHKCYQTIHVKLCKNK